MLQHSTSVIVRETPQIPASSFFFLVTSGCTTSQVRRGDLDYSKVFQLVAIPMNSAGKSRAWKRPLIYHVHGDVEAFGLQKRPPGSSREPPSCMPFDPVSSD